MHRSARTDLSKMVRKGKGSKKGQIDHFNETYMDTDGEVHNGVNTGGVEDSTFNHDKMMRPFEENGDDAKNGAAAKEGVNVKSIKTRDFRFISVKKVEGNN